MLRRINVELKEDVQEKEEQVEVARLQAKGGKLYFPTPQPRNLAALSVYYLPYLNKLQEICCVFSHI